MPLVLGPSRATNLSISDLKPARSPSAAPTGDPCANTAAITTIACVRRSAVFIDWYPMRGRLAFPISSRNAGEKNSEDEPDPLPVTPRSRTTSVTEINLTDTTSVSAVDPAAFRPAARSIPRGGDLARALGGRAPLA